MQQLKTSVADTLQRYLKTDVRYLFKGGFWLATGQGLFMLTGFLLSIAFANLLPKNDFGTYQYILTVSTIIGAFTLSGMGLAVRRAAARGEDGMLRYGFRVKTKWNGSILAIAGALSAYYFYNQNSTLGTSFLIVAVTLPLIESFRLYQQFLLGKGLFKESTTLGLRLRPLTPVAMFIALLSTDSVPILITTYFGTVLLTTGFAYFVTIRKYALPIIRDDDSVSYGKKLSGINMLRMVANHADKLIIFQTLGATTMAIFALAKLPTTHLMKAWSLVGHLVFPRFAQHSFHHIQKSMPKKLLFFYFVTLLVIGSFILLAPYLYALLFPQYSESVVLAQVLILSLFAKPATLITQAFEAHKLVRQQVCASVSSLLLKIVLAYTLIDTYGVWGAVYAQVLTSAYWGTITLILFFLYKERPGNEARAT